jgi:predicted hydrolase (HD superfamily)
MINREEALQLVKKYLHDKNSLRQSLAVEAILREIARRLGRDEEIWGLAGLLHNLDYEFTMREPEKRGNLSGQLLEGLLPERAVNAIKSNNYIYTEQIPITSLDKALIATEALVGLLFVIVSLTPTKKLNEINTDILMEKYNDPTFAVRYKRNRIDLIQDTGIELDTFIVISLNTLNNISEELEL